LSRPRPRVRNCLGVLYDLVKVLPCFIFTHLQHLAQNKQRGCARCRRVGELELSGPLGICKLLPGLWKLVLTPFFGVIRNSEREDIGPDPIPLLLMHLDRPFKHFPILCSLRLIGSEKALRLRELEGDPATTAIPDVALRIRLLSLYPVDDVSSATVSDIHRSADLIFERARNLFRHVCCLGRVEIDCSNIVIAPTAGSPTGCETRQRKNSSGRYRNSISLDSSVGI